MKIFFSKKFYKLLDLVQKIVFDMLIIKQNWLFKKIEKLEKKVGKFCSWSISLCSNFKGNFTHFQKMTLSLITKIWDFPKHVAIVLKFPFFESYLVQVIIFLKLISWWQYNLLCNYTTRQKVPPKSVLWIFSLLRVSRIWKFCSRVRFS